MKLASTTGPLGKTSLRSSFWTLGAAVSLVLAACGGSPSSSPVPEAVVISVINVPALEGQTGATPLLEFVVNLDKPVVQGLAVSFSTSSTAKEGVASTGSAKGAGDCGTAGVDFVAVPSKQITIAAGSSTGRLTVAICPDAVFEPNETLNLKWTSPGSAGGVAVGTIINDDAGGLNGTGATALLGGLSAYGRDVNPLTNSATDGALGFSFDKSNTECVVDKVTGLTWQKLPVVTQVYADLVAYVTSINTAAPCGFSDWRVPTANELLSLMDASKTTVNPAGVINADYVGTVTATDAMSGKFWSSESRAVASGTATDAWQVDVSTGAAISFATKTNLLGVRLVHGATRSLLVCNSDPRFTDLLDGTIEDSTTGLMWKACPEGYVYSGGVCTASSKIAFAGATEVVTQLNAANMAKAEGYSDWRLPTKNELASIVSRACTGTTIDAKFGLGTGNLNFVTATLDADAPTTRVWGIDFTEGSIGPNQLADSFRLRLVRAGQ